MIPAPRIDSRTSSDIEQQLRTLLSTYAPDWKGAGVPGDFGHALVRIFARYAEIVIDRLNRTPDKNLLAYLDLLGASLLPPQPARVPLTFSLAAGSAADGVVPAATQVAAPPAEGDTAPAIFETERELVVIAAALDKVFARDPGTDCFADLSPSTPVSGDRRAFRGTTPLDHSLYIGLDDLLGLNGLRELRLDVDIAPDPPTPGPRAVSWSIVDGTGGTPIVPTSDGTAGLAHSGRIVFAFPIPGLPEVPRQSVNGLPSRWLRGRLATPIGSQNAATGQVSAAHLPNVLRIDISAVLGGSGLPIDRAFGNAAPLDTTKDFFPFGERPRLGDALYLSAGDAFAVAGAQVTVHVTLSVGNAPNVAGKPALTNAAAKPALKWEYWDGGRWAELGALSDGTTALKGNGGVKFRLGPHPAIVAVNGADGYWLRVRIAAGNYGGDASYVPVDANDLAKGYRYVPPTFAPPSIAAVTADYEVELTGRRADRILTYNDFAYDEIKEGASFQPFRPTADGVPTLYLGFVLPATRSAFPNRPVGLYLGIHEPASGAQPDKRAPAEPPRLVWECSVGGAGWQRPGLRDGTQGLTRPGVLEFLAPAAFALRQEFGAERYWLRCRWEAGSFAFKPRLQRVLLNTIMATHASTILDETLGSSDGSQSQRYVTARRPVLHDQEELRVREPDLPSADERAALETAGGDDAIAMTLDAVGRPVEIWARWHEVPDFYASGPRDRHYVLDHVTGTVSFGDGVNGLVPPTGAGNLRLARYRTGGGSVGNCAACTIVQLKTTIPYVESVTNHEPARGGADAETLDALRARAPRAIRHRDRAVTVEDYEDLAMLASPEVARVKCVPLYDLSKDPDAKVTGIVSVIVVPRSTEAEPSPSRVLVERVASYLDARRFPVVELKIVGPDYVEIDIAAEVALTSIDRASAVQPLIVDSLRRFLHPLTGGFDGSGWDFGRRPQKSDLLRRIGGIAGVDHVRSLKVPETPLPRTALVSVGKLDITVVAGNV